MAESGVLIVDKPQGWTSHQVVGRCRRLLGTRKVGHAGTLDPMATGVLVVGVERATRLLGHLAGADKSYQATIRLGQATVTDDAEGEITQSAGAVVDRAAIEQAVLGYQGVIVQVPSAVSAIKVNGQRAYALVRSGQEVELRGREVTISRYQVLGHRLAMAGDLPVVDVDVVVDCSSGTYIRALARDLGRDLGVGGHLTALRRTRVGRFELADATLDAAGLAGEDRPSMLCLAEVARRAFPVLEVDDATAAEIRFGRPLPIALEAAVVAMLHEDTLLALYQPNEDGSKPLAVLC
ncbi:MAG: tRNA pseudouridine(55) synthase TruB [Micropruina sp.]